MKSTIIKAVMQTQFENCVSAFLGSLFQTKAGKVVWMGFEIIILLEGYFLMTIKVGSNDLGIESSAENSTL